MGTPLLRPLKPGGKELFRVLEGEASCGTFQEQLSPGLAPHLLPSRLGPTGAAAGGAEAILTVGQRGLHFHWGSSLGVGRRPAFLMSSLCRQRSPRERKLGGRQPVWTLLDWG